MRIAIVHYHLQTGGVTRIIECAAKALKQRQVSLVVLTGELPSRPLGADVRTIPRLAYEEHRSAGTPADLADDLMREARDALGALPDVWHVHNHTLGKNLLLPGALRHLIQAGQMLFLQIHDFAEDSRPFLYRRLLSKIGNNSVSKLSEDIYPNNRQIHYGVLTQRDRRLLLTAGGDPARIHLLPNPVEQSNISCRPHVPEHVKERIWLYPTRAIRRKNIGEFLLWSSICDPHDRFVTTLAPLNPREQIFYKHWCRLAEELKLPVIFEAGLDKTRDYQEWLHAAYAIITTSVAEGYGMAFLEPWMIGKPLYGRNLADITADFNNDGIQLTCLYDRLWVPIDWIGRDSLVKKIRDALSAQDLVYGHQAKPDDLDRFMAAWTRENRVDFGRLDEVLQTAIIRRLHGSLQARKEIRPFCLDSCSIDLDTIVSNQRVLSDKYSLTGYARRLMQVYQEIADSGDVSGEALDGSRILDFFLEPEHFSLLRVDIPLDQNDIQ